MARFTTRLPGAKMARAPRVSIVFCGHVSSQHFPGRRLLFVAVMTEPGEILNANRHRGSFKSSEILIVFRLTFLNRKTFWSRAYTGLGNLAWCRREARVVSCRPRLAAESAHKAATPRALHSFGRGNRMHEGFPNAQLWH
jgi:hypothetical protein